MALLSVVAVQDQVHCVERAECGGSVQLPQMPRHAKQGSKVDWQLVGLISGACLLGFTLLQGLTAVVRHRRRVQQANVRRHSQRQLFDRQLQAVLNWARAAKPIYKAWSGTRPMQVAAVEEEALDCKSYYLLPQDGRPLPRFEPGQYLTFELPVQANQASIVRCYSLSDRPREDYYRVTVKRIVANDATDASSSGQGSGYFHREVKVGTTLQVRAPQGAFFLDPRGDWPVVLIGAGIGITPIVSMIQSIDHDLHRRQAFVFGGFRNSREHPLGNIMREIAGKHENIHFDISYSRPMPGDQRGRDFDHRGRVDISRLREVLPSNNFRFYLCGPAAMMESLVPALLDWGVPDDHIYFEAFGPASVKRLRSRDSESHSVSFARTNKNLLWTGEEPSLLEFAESNGVVLDSGCRAGNCGQCLTGVRSGKCSHLKSPGVPVGEKQCLTCIAIPEDDLVLEA